LLILHSQTVLRVNFPTFHVHFSWTWIYWLCHS